MSIGIEALFTSALGLQSPWVFEAVKPSVPAQRIDFEAGCSGPAARGRFAFCFVEVLQESKQWMTW
jgi:hypothetical protein